MGLLLTLSSVLSTTFNSPLGTSVTGNIKVRRELCNPLSPTSSNRLLPRSQDVFLTAAGWVLFGGMPVTLKSIVGLIGTFLAAFAYSYIGLVKQQQSSSESAGTIQLAAAGDRSDNSSKPPLSADNKDRPATSEGPVDLSCEVAVPVANDSALRRF